jgi:hypothetical protein
VVYHSQPDVWFLATNFRITATSIFTGVILIRTFFSTLLVYFFITAPAFCREHIVDLSLHKIYSIQAPENFQPSGLTIFDGSLYTVSDKHDSFIYRLALSENIATAVPAVKISLPLISFIRSYDFEGITHDDLGNFYLVSEAQCRILRISRDGNRSDWITPDLKPSGKKAGLFTTANAYLEGICCITPNEFVVCAERQQRGFLEINLENLPINIIAYASEESLFKFPEGTSKDFSGLCRFRNNIFVLERNAYLFSKLKKANNQLIETKGWSYRHIETDEANRYEDMEFGKAEGLCIDDQFIYIIIDNNNDPRAADPDDRRPILMVFDHPDNF